MTNPLRRLLVAVLMAVLAVFYFAGRVVVGCIAIVFVSAEKALDAWFEVVFPTEDK